jgi:hypothetical protein
MLSVETPRERTLDAARMIADRYGVPDQVRQLERAEDASFEPLAVALLAEAVAALLIELPPGSPRAKGGR